MNFEEKKRFPLRSAYAFAAANGLSTYANEIRDMEVEWTLSYTSTVRRGRLIRLFEQHALMPQFVSEHWPFGGTAAGEAAKRNALRVAQMYDDFLSGDVEPDAEDELDQAEVDSPFEFALEAHLRDFLARNLEQIEPGLRLFELGGRTGVEYPVDGGRIDILAMDRSGHPVVVELKVAQGRNKALGQLLYYMGWVDQNLGRGVCRGVVIASEISTGLAVAVSRVPGVILYRYKMNFSLEHSGGHVA